MNSIDKQINDKLLFFEEINKEVIQSSIADNKTIKNASHNNLQSESQINSYNKITPILSSSLIKSKKSCNSLNSTFISTGLNKCSFCNINKQSNKKDKDYSMNKSFTFQPQINNHSRELVSGLKPSYNKPLKKALLNKCAFVSSREYSPYRPKEQIKDKDIVNKVFLYHRNIVLKKEAEKNNKQKHNRSLEINKDIDYNGNCNDNSNIHKSFKRFSKENFDNFINVNKKKVLFSERKLFEIRQKMEYKEKEKCPFKPVLSHLNISVDESNIKHQIPYINDYVKLRRATIQTSINNKSIFYTNTIKEIKVSQRKYILDKHKYIVKEN